jgi:hypothetical protein
MRDVEERIAITWESLLKTRLLCSMMNKLERLMYWHWEDIDVI